MLHIWGDMRYTNWLMYLMLVLSIFSEAVFPDQEMYLIGRGGGGLQILSKAIYGILM